MTKKELQEKENAIVEKFIADMANRNLEVKEFKRLRTCSAEVGITEDFYLLWSYRTNIAVIDRKTGILYDYLRKVYGYTATSAQHISKFGRDYGAQHKYTYKPI